MKVRIVKLANAVKVGADESNVFRTEQRYDVDMIDKFWFRLRSKKGGAATYTTLMNVIYVEFDDDTEMFEPKPTVVKRTKAE